MLMKPLRCLSCGANITVEEGATIATCEYCGNSRPVPKVDDEKKLRLFDRADNFLGHNEFDKAEGIYESIVADFPNEMSAYWGIVLCRYGIEYVKDPPTGKRIPTCHRLSYDSILDDIDYKSAIQNADWVAKEELTKQANELERIRKEILKQTEGEEPFDIFISYKEEALDGSHERTTDSVIAQEIYQKLNAKGYRVFYSRITLREEGLGKDYEPVIFSALNSAKIMLLIGTNRDHIDSTWVRNEWSRYLHFMKVHKGSGDKRMIVCYRDMAVQDLPDELKLIEAVNLASVGAEHDLFYNIEKILPTSDSVNKMALGEQAVQVFQAEASKLHTMQNQFDSMKINAARQAIVDSAYRRIEQAEKNVFECEKIDTKYVGTIIARLCYRMMAVITPGACRSEEIRSMYQRIKDDYSLLRDMGDGIGEEEREFYEFISSADSSSDAFAELIIVFDTLGDSVRANALFDFLDAGRVYSKDCNKDLLAFSLKADRLDTARRIIANRNNIDGRSALDVVLKRCPDSEGKAEMAVTLLKSGAYDVQDRDKIQDYIMSKDSCGTKVRVIGACGVNGTLPPMSDIVEYVLSKATVNDLKIAIDGICKGQIIDSELYTLMDFAFHESADKVMVVVDGLIESGRYTVIEPRNLKAIFVENSCPVDDRIEIWEKLRGLSIDQKVLNSVMNEYLCNTKDSAGDRKKMIDSLLSGVKNVTPAVLERYLLNYTVDGENKPEIVRSIFALDDVRPAYFADILGKYIKKSPDDNNVKKAVEDVLIDVGLSLDPNSINDFICSQGTSGKEKVELLRKLERNHSHMRADALSVYLEKCANSYDDELFTYLFEKATVVSETAIRNFVLVCPVNASSKARKAIALAKKQSTSFGSTACQVIHLSHKVSCNLAQAYLLTTDDSYETASVILREMTVYTKLTSDIFVDGMAIKIKKYVKNNRAKLTPVAQRLCDENKMFSLF